MPRRIAVFNQKGGVGKTTTSVNLAAGLAGLGCRSLIVDIDTQRGSSYMLGHTDSEKNVVEVLAAGPDADLRALVQANTVPTAIDKVHLLGGSTQMAGAEARMMQGSIMAAMGRLKRVLDSSDLSSYEYVIVDCPPNVGILSGAALIACGEVLLPVTAEPLAVNGLIDAMRFLGETREIGHEDMKITGILLTQVSQVRLANDIAAGISRAFPSLLLETRIRRNVRIAESPSSGKPVQSYSPSSAGARDYNALAEEIHERKPVSYEDFLKSQRQA